MGQLHGAASAALTLGFESFPRPLSPPRPCTQDHVRISDPEKLFDTHANRGAVPKNLLPVGFAPVSASVRRQDWNGSLAAAFPGRQKEIKVGASLSCLRQTVGAKARQSFGPFLFCQAETMSQLLFWSCGGQPLEQRNPTNRNRPDRPLKRVPNSGWFYRHNGRAPAPARTNGG